MNTITQERGGKNPDKKGNWSHAGTTPHIKHDIRINEESGYAQSYPHIFSIEVTSRCNIRCIMCGFHSKYRKEPIIGKDISNKLFEKAMSFVKEAELVPLCGGGEPLLKTDLPEMVNGISELGIPTVITTNAQLLTKNLSRELVLSGLSYIEISVDGKESYEKIRGASFEKLKKNLVDLSKMKKKLGSDNPVIDLSYTAMKDTLLELPDLIDLAVEIGAREIRVQPLQICFEEMMEQNIYGDPDRTRELLEKAGDYAKSRDIIFSARRCALTEDRRYGDDHRFNEKLQKYNCLEPFTSMTVRTDGSIQVCCGGIELERTLNDHSLDKLWNCSEMMKLRRELITGEFREKCRNCNLIHGSRDNQIIMEKKLGLSDVLKLDPEVARQYVELIRNQGIIKGNIHALKKLKKELYRDKK